MMYRPNTETSSCFNEPLVSTSGSVKTTFGSAEGMTHSNVFRSGDYDVVTGPDEYISIYKRRITPYHQQENCLVLLVQEYLRKLKTLKLI